MRSFLSSRRVTSPIRTRPKAHPGLETLEDRCLLDGGMGEELVPLGMKRTDGTGGIRGWMDREYLHNNQLLLPYSEVAYLEQKGALPDLKGPVDPGQRADVLINNNAGTSGTGNFTQSEMSIAAWGNNVVIGYNDSGSFTGGVSSFTGFSYSTDGGVTFTDGGRLPITAIGDAGDPVLARDEVSGRLYFSTLGFNTPANIQMFRSDDGGVTWSPPVNATPGGSSEDKQWHIVDNFAGTGQGNVYMMSRRFGSTGGGPGIYVFRSTDGGATFGPTNGVQIVAGAQGAFIEVLPDHSVVAFWFAGSTLQMRRSTDFGLTFGPAVTVATGLTGGTNGDLGLTGLRQGTSTFSGFRSNEFPHVAVNRVSGHIYVTYNNNPAGTDKADVFLVMSTDNGATWSAPFQVNDDGTTTDQWMPTIAISPNGTNLGVFYYSRQEDIANNNLFKYYGRTATVSGGTLTWAPSFAVSEVASIPEFGRDGVVNSVYQGDYNHAVATNTDFHVVWSDNRDDLAGGAGRKDPNVYYKKLAITNPEGPAVIAATPAGNVAPAVSSYTVTFDRDVDASTFTTADIVTFNGPGGSLLGAITGVTPLTARQFRIDFAAQSATGTYTIVFGPNVLDTTGVPMDQDGDGTTGEATEDQYTGTFGITGPRVTASTPGGTVDGPVGSVVFTFNRAMDPASFTTDDITFTGPGGVNLVPQISAITPSAGNTVFTVTFTNQGPPGTYTMVVGPNITDTFGNQLDQDNDLIPGEATQDRVTNTFTVSNLRITASNPVNGAQVVSNVSSVTVTFGKAILASSFTTGDVAITGPGGTILATGIVPLSATQYRIDFATQTALGAYTVTVGPAITDNNPNAMDQDNDNIPGETTDAFTVAFTLVDALTIGPDGFGYTGRTIAGLGIDLVEGAAGVFVVFDNVDDSFTSVNLGANTFNAYGFTTSTVFVSSNGLITLGSGNSSLSNGDLTTAPTQITFAPFWDDLHLGRNANDKILGRFDGLGDADPLNDFLILEWNQVEHFSFGGSATFQIVLQLNRGVNTSDVYFNYVDTVFGNAAVDNGASASTGIKDAGTQGANRLLANFNQGNNLWVGDNKAIKWSAPPFGSTLTGQKYNDLDRDGTKDAGEPPLANWQIYIDANNNGNLDAGERSTFTDANGNYTFAEVLPAQGIRIREVNQPGWTQTTPTVTGYAAVATTFEALDLVDGGAGVFLILDGADDSSVSVNLGANVFRFYGSAFTGTSQLFASSNGLITLGGADSSFTNADLTTTPTLRAIAPFWDDLHTGRNANDKLLGRFDGIGDADPNNDRLIIEWNDVESFSFGGAATFQAILQLNTPVGTNGRITFNYVDTVFGDASVDNAASATVGIKDVGTQGPNRVLVSFNATNTLIGSGKAVLVQPVSGAPGPHVVNLGIRTTAANLDFGNFRNAVPTVLVDNTNFGFSTRGTWTTVAGGHGGSYRVNTGGGDGSQTAQWLYGQNFTAGTSYEFFVTWVPSAANATNAQYKVFQGATQLGTVVINQTLTPDTTLVNGSLWKSLFVYTPATTGYQVIRVQVDNSGNGNIVADAIFDPPIGGEAGVAAAGTGSEVVARTAVTAARPVDTVFQARESQLFGAAPVVTPGDLGWSVVKAARELHGESLARISDSKSNDDELADLTTLEDAGSDAFLAMLDEQRNGDARFDAESEGSEEVADEVFGDFAILEQQPSDA